jgi:hypothetical protein
MDVWRWIPAGLAAWFAVAAAAALWLGAVPGSCSQAPEAPDQHPAIILALPRKQPQHWRQAS